MIKLQIWALLMEDSLIKTYKCTLKANTDLFAIQQAIMYDTP